MNECKFCQKPVRGVYCGPTCQWEHYFQILKEKIENNQSGNGVDCRQIKKYLKKINGPQCQMCKITEWLNKPVVLILDHVDGNSKNWRLDNLRLLCSNCDSTLPTYKKRNVGNGRFSRKERYSNGLSY